jgi:hypothetical protein
MTNRQFEAGLILRIAHFRKKNLKNFGDILSKITWRKIMLGWSKSEIMQDTDISGGKSGCFSNTAGKIFLVQLFGFLAWDALSLRRPFSSHWLTGINER